MSADCLFVVHRCRDLRQLKDALLSITGFAGYGVWFSPNNGLLECKQINLDEDTFLFEPTDAPDRITSGLLLSPDYYSIDGIKPRVSIEKRADLIQEIVKLSLQFSEGVDIYISEDNAYLPDFKIYEIDQNQVSITLLKEYESGARFLEPIPCICMKVTK